MRRRLARQFEPEPSLSQVRHGTSCQAKITRVERLAPGIISFWLEAESIARAAKPGHFVQVRVGRDCELLLRRPISIADVHGNLVRLVFRVVGQGTAALAQSCAGDELDLLGPLGRPVPLLRNRNLVLVGGGIGIAPLLFLARYSAQVNRVEALLGARNREELILVNEFRGLPVKIRVATEDGSLGRKGRVTELLAEQLGTEPALPLFTPVVFACGPRPMLKTVKRLSRNSEAYAFWEERLGCGTGICYGCAVRSARGNRYIRFCQDGPVLNLKDVEV